MTKFRVDSPDLIDAVKRAAKISPNNTTDDRMAGIKFELQADVLLVKATDLETTVRVEVPVQAEGPIDPFRLPANVLHGYLQRLPTGPGSEVRFEVLSDRVKLSSAGCRATFKTILGDGFARVDAFDTSGMLPVEGLADKLAQVRWAVHPETVPYCGIHITGTQLMATELHQMAVVDCIVPVDKPITAPLAGITEALRGYKGPIDMAVRERKLLLMPEPEVQLRSNVYALEPKFPSVEIGRLFEMVRTNPRLTLEKQPLLDALSRLAAMAQNQKPPYCRISFSGDLMTMRVTDPEYGEVEEVIELEDVLPHEQSVGVNPLTFSKAIDGSSTSLVTIGWPNNPRLSIYLTDDAGYEAALAPIIK